MAEGSFLHWSSSPSNWFSRWRHWWHCSPQPLQPHSSGSNRTFWGNRSLHLWWISAEWKGSLCHPHRMSYVRIIPGTGFLFLVNVFLQKPYFWQQLAHYLGSAVGQKPNPQTPWGLLWFLSHRSPTTGLLYVFPMGAANFLLKRVMWIKRGSKNVIRTYC